MRGDWPCLRATGATACWAAWISWTFRSLGPTWPVPSTCCSMPRQGLEGAGAHTCPHTHALACFALLLARTRTQARAHITSLINPLQSTCLHPRPELGGLGWAVLAHAQPGGAFALARALAQGGAVRHAPGLRGVAPGLWRAPLRAEALQGAEALSHKDGKAPKEGGNLHWADMVSLSILP